MEVCCGSSRTGRGKIARVCSGAIQDDGRKIHMSGVSRVIAEDDTARLLEAVGSFRKEVMAQLGKGAKTSRILNQEVPAKLLHSACKYDAVQCARLLLEGGHGITACPVDIRDHVKRTPLRVAAEMQSARCIELLLSKNARTDSCKLVDGRPLLALEIALRSRRVKVEWSPENSVKDLLVYLQQMDLKAVKLLAEKTREVGQVAYRYAMEGRVTALAMLLQVANAKISSPVSVMIDGIRTKRSIYNSVVDEVLSNGDALARECNERRKALLCEIQLLNQFGASSWRDPNIDKRSLPPLLRAAKVGDMEVTKMLLMGDVDVNEPDPEGNTPLSFAVKNGSVNCVNLLLRFGANPKAQNLRKQRQIDMATSEDMRLILNSANVAPRSNSSLEKNHVMKKERRKELLDDDYDSDEFSESYTLLKTSAGHRDFRSSNSSAQRAKSKSQSAPKQGTKFSQHNNHWEKHDYTREIFVGGLPLSVDNAYLSDFFAAEFGPVEEAEVITIKKDDRIQSRGFGFVKFQREKDMVRAKEAHHVYVLGKRVEIKGAVSRASLPPELQRSFKQRTKEPGFFSKKNTGDKDGITVAEEKCHSAQR